MGDKKSITESLKTFPMFQNVEESDLKELSKLLTVQTFPAGKVIIKEGTEGDTMYLLTDGVVDILKTTAFGDEYVTASVSSEYSCVFGEMALIDNAPRSATVRANTECKTLMISKKDFQAYCRQYPRVGCELLFIISTTLVRNLRKENENLKLVYEALIEEIESE